MKSQWLLPHRFRLPGWILLVPALVFGVMVLHFDYKIPGLVIELGGSDIFCGTQDLTDELAFSLVWVALIAIGFSKERFEDEGTRFIRLEALIRASWIYSILLFAVVWTVYCDAFLSVLIYNLFSFLIIYIVCYEWMKRTWRRQSADEE